MFRNRISVVRRAKNATKPSSIKSSLSSTNEEGAKGDGPCSLPVELGQLGCFSRASVVEVIPTPSADESVVMENGKPDEGICIDETVFTLDDSGEIRENELRLTVDDENDVTKDLDFSRQSPALALSLTTPKRARMLLEIQKSVERNGSAMAVPVSSSTPFLPVSERSGFSSLKTTQSEISPALFRWNVEETPMQQQQQHQAQQTPLSSSRSTGTQSKQAGDLKRQSITGAIDDLNEMTEELIDFIKGFEEKYSTAIN